MFMVASYEESWRNRMEGSTARATDPNSRKGNDFRKGNEMIRMSTRNDLVWFAAVLLSFAVTTESRAQLFGPRTLGRPLSRQAPPSLEQGAMQAGALQGNERFLRGQRRASDFVGTDRSEARAFVGVQQAGQPQTVPTAVEGLRERRSAGSVNPPRPPVAPNQMYERLAVDFNVTPRADSVTATDLSRRLTRSMVRGDGTTIEVSVVGRKAILRGEVASERLRDLARLVTLFEPGISEVQNDLVVRPLDPLPPPPRSVEDAR